MDVFNENICTVMGLTILFSVIIDLLMGDRNSKYHPVMLIGKTIGWLRNKLRTGKQKIDKLLGIFLILCVVLLYCMPIILLQLFLLVIMDFFIPVHNQFFLFLGILLYSFIAGFILKWSFAIRNLGDVTKPIFINIKQDNIEDARLALSYIVRRDTKSLDQSKIISATVEVIAESSTDAVTSVFWFFLVGNLFGAIIYSFLNQNALWLYMGIPFAYIYRIINTADSVVGYKDEENINIGWFSAKMDDVANYIPTRLTVFFMLIAGKMMSLDINNAWKVLKTDRKTTESVNAGWTMGAMAGLLQVQLEKVGKYKLGLQLRPLQPEDIQKTYCHIKLTMIIFIISISTLMIGIIYSIFTVFL